MFPSALVFGAQAGVEEAKNEPYVSEMNYQGLNLRVTVSRGVNEV
jgi:hypothetical protein